MCLAIPGRVSELKGRGAVVAYPNESRQVMVGIENLSLGDWVMVQMGVIIKKLEESEAKEMEKAWAETAVEG